jgi:hypothetical protein
MMLVELVADISENNCLHLQGEMCKQWSAVSISSFTLQCSGVFCTDIGLCVAGREAEQNFRVLFPWPVVFWNEVMRWMRQHYQSLVFILHSICCFHVPSQNKEFELPLCRNLVYVGLSFLMDDFSGIVRLFIQNHGVNLLFWTLPIVFIIQL